MHANAEELNKTNNTLKLVSRDQNYGKINSHRDQNEKTKLLADKAAVAGSNTPPEDVKSE